MGNSSSIDSSYRNSAVRDRFEADGAYGSQIKGNSQVSTALPPWPAPSRDNETMFLAAPGPPRWRLHQCLRQN
ncbi:unnamed protein product [Plutella xylostella]|uniref:(diamondback moth) hypothetical protein n=1 Tax=Plutella xylostella TaxID=51655 RepID=A0A8S4G8C5_PLUXY|nr:unnamed protein product [Plutella xylostella]